MSTTVVAREPALQSREGSATHGRAGAGGDGRERNMAARRATIFGGSGFIGRYIVRRLAAEGTVVRVAVRRPNEALFLKPMGNVGQIVPVAADVRDAATVQAAVR